MRSNTSPSQPSVSSVPGSSSSADDSAEVMVFSIEVCPSNGEGGHTVMRCPPLLFTLNAPNGQR